MITLRTAAAVLILLTILGAPTAVRAATTEGGADKYGPSESLGLALQLEEAFAAASDKVSRSVVGITAYVRDPDWTRTKQFAGKDPGWKRANAARFRYEGYRPVRSASGIILDEEGTILTGHHLVADLPADRANLFDIELPGEVHVQGRHVGSEPTINLAVLEVDDSLVLTPVEPADPESPRIGSWTLAAGDPPGPERTLSVGVLSARPIRDCYQESLTSTYLQSSVQIHPESYGGPLFDIHGRVLGITTPRYDTASRRAGPDSGTGITFALPLDLATTVARSVRAAESETSPWLGFSVRNLSYELRRTMRTPRTGILIEDLYEPGPGSRAGIRPGDFLVSMGGRPIVRVADFQRWLYLFGVGKTVDLEIYREGETITREVTIAQRPPEATTH